MSHISVIGAGTLSPIAESKSYVRTSFDVESSKQGSKSWSPPSLPLAKSQLTERQIKVNKQSPNVASRNMKGATTLKMNDSSALYQLHKSLSGQSLIN